MKTASLALLCALVLLTVFTLARAQEGWDILPSPTMAVLRDVKFTDPFCGTVVGDQTTILRTDDGGLSWIPQTAPPLNERLHAISFATESVALIGGDGGVILFTEDGGEQWNVIQDGWYIIYYGVHQLTPERGIVAGVNSIFGPLIAHTSNSWQDCTVVAFYLRDPQGIDNEGSLRDIEMLSDSVAVAPAVVWDGGGAIVRTTNGGQTWSTVFWGLSGLTAVDFPTPTIGYAVGWSGRQLKTTDGGQSWMVLPDPIRIHWYDVDFANADTGWSVGENSSIYRTDDGGNTWRCQHSASGDLYGVHAVNTDTVYAVGQNGMMLKTVTGGDPPSESRRPSRPSPAADYSLCNYPNPFNATTVISFSLPRSGRALVRVLDITGREVFRRDLGTMEPGAHRITFDASGLASGVYVACLETPRAAVNHKMVLLR